MSEIPLRPCPFCLNPNPSYRESMIGEFIVCCNKCRADGPQAKTSAEAERLWNGDFSGVKKC